VFPALPAYLGVKDRQVSQGQVDDQVQRAILVFLALLDFLVIH